MKFLLTIAFTFLVALFPTYSFAQTENETTTSTETITGDETTTTTSQDTTEEIETEGDEVTTTPDDIAKTTDDVITTTDDPNTTLETTTADESAQSGTIENTTKTATEEKTITDYLPYILLGGAGILLISIIAIIFSGKEPKEKKVKTEEKEPLPEAPRFEQKTEIQPQTTVNPTMPEVNTMPEISPQAVSTSVEDLVQKPSDQNMQEDLAALNSQPTTTVTEENTQPNIQEMAPVTPTLDTPITNEEQIQNIAAQIPTAEETPAVETPITDAPVESFGMQTPTLHTPEPTPTVETPAVPDMNSNTPQPIEIDPMLAQLSQSPDEIDASMNQTQQNTIEESSILETVPQAVENTVPPVQETPIQPIIEEPQVMQTVEPTPQPVQNTPIVNPNLGANNSVNQPMVKDTPVSTNPVSDMNQAMPTVQQPVSDEEMPPAPPIM